MSEGTQAPEREESSYARTPTGVWRQKPAVNAPVFILSSHVQSSLTSPEHFLIPVSLSFPDRKPIRTYALVDCGATASCISLNFANRHSLPRRLKDEPVPITAVDDRPIASGLVTHDVITSLSIRSHHERLALAVVSVHFPVILGLDWLRRHNPDIDWARNRLALSCCGANPSYPVSALGKGFGLAQVPALMTSMQSSSVTCAGLGLGLNGAILSPAHPDHVPRSDQARYSLVARKRSYLAESVTPPILSPPSTSIGFGQTGIISSIWNHLADASASLNSPPEPPPLNISFINS